jgi:D-alanyl-D-alanine dipeptidase
MLYFMNKLDVNEIIPLNAFLNTYPIEIDVVYAQKTHPDNHFPDLYSPEAKIMWAHKDIAAVTLRAAQICNELYGWIFKINDCLRPVEAQQGMETYEYDPSLVSKPASGAHPRAMAIDIEPIDSSGDLVPMGTAFDYFAENPDLDNPAARNYTKFSDIVLDNAAIWSNRQKLEFSMRWAATSLGREILPLPQEWWDFREVEAVWDKWKPLKEMDLLPCQRLIDVDVEEIKKILDGQYPDAMKQNIDHVKAIVGGTIHFT